MSLISGFRQRHLLVTAGLCVLLAGASPAALAQTVDLDAMEALLRAGRAEEAYQTLAAAEAERAGEVEFDYLLGLAALESGRADAATFAFERVLTLRPDFLGARLDMARAYFTLGNDDLARRELEALREQDPPAPARAAIERYLEAIEERGRKTRVRFYAEAGAGYDSNANAATGDTDVFVPALNATVTLDASSSAVEDAYLSARAGVELSHALTDGLAFRAGASAGSREYLSSDGQETTDYGVELGLVYTDGPAQWRFTTSLRRQELDWDPYQTLFGIGGEWRYSLDQRTQVALFAQHNRQRYIPAASQGNDSNLNLAGAAVQHTLDDAGRTLLSAGGYVGVDAERSTRIDGSRELFGGRIGLQRRVLPELDAYAAAALQWSVFDRRNSLFQVRRRDTQLDFSAGLSWRALDSLSVQPQVSVRRNVSEVPINDYSRVQAGVDLRWEF